MTDHNNTSPPLIDSNRFWAVVIGIDAYVTEKPLHGCVSDATDVFRYLTTSLKVPTNHIKLLLGTTDALPQLSPDTVTIPATRANIVDALLDLSTNIQIQRGDNIIIYFSGHGSYYPCNLYYLADTDTGTPEPDSAGTIEALCPMDRNPLATEVDKQIPDICDRELSTILSEICRTKGHHITIILDCCHASGATRDITTAKGSVGVVRQAKDAHKRDAIAVMFDAAEKRLNELRDENGVPRYVPISAGNWEHHEGTHVLLAACQSYELATEVFGGKDTYHGVFTEALLHKFEEVGSKGEFPTYLACLEGLRDLSEFKQFPVSSGNMNDRLWYTDPAPNTRRWWNPLQYLVS